MPGVSSSRGPAKKYTIIDSRRGGKTLLYAGHNYHKLRQNKKTVVWQCVNKRSDVKCSGSIILDSQNQTVVKECKHSNKCVPSFIINEVSRAMSECKQEIATNFTSVQKTFEKHMRSLKDKGYHLTGNIPDYKSVKSMFYRHRNKSLVSTVLVVGTNDTMTKNLKVLVTSPDYPESGLKVLREHFTVLQKKDNAEDLMKLIPGVSALVWLSHGQLTKELLDRAGPQLKLIATVSAGYNHLNPDELRARGLKLANTPDVLSSAVAEVAVSLMLGAARRFTENLNQVRSGVWDTGFMSGLGQDIRGSTVGIIGFGGIGQATARRLAGFEVAKFIYSGHREKPEGKALGAEFVSQDELLSQSDFVLLALPLTNETRHIINRDTLSKMKKNAILVNVGRGDLVDQDALYEALNSRQIYAAGLDVTTPEPLPKDHKLLSLPNIFILPHIGSATVRTRNDMAVLAAKNVVNGLTGKPLITPVNL